VDADGPDAIARHYTHGDLRGALLAAMTAQGVAPEELTLDLLAPLDELHTGGRAATRQILGLLGLTEDTRLLDVGSGLGGPARVAAAERGCAVVGVDLTPEFVEVAAWLTELVGLSERVRFELGHGARLPVDDGAADAALWCHVGMNVADKAAVFREVRRALRPGGSLAVYDLMATGDGAVPYPMPWAVVPDDSFVERPDDYRAALAGAGFVVVHERPRGDLASGFFREMREAGPPPPLSQAVVMGPGLRPSLGNLADACEAGLLTPVEMLAVAAA
jgi:SAM-dependent methyltransferase